MATIVLPWNPFQDQIVCDLKNQTIKTATDLGRYEFVPRCAPFFAKNFKLRVRGATTDLVLGVDYAFGHSFDRFINDYKKNVFGSVILLRNFGNQVLEADYSSIGGPFILDEVAFATLAANIMNSPRVADWSSLVNVPATWPVDPHDHPAGTIYNMEDMLLNLRQLILVLTNTQDTVNVLGLLNAHVNKPISQAHTGGKAELALDQVSNLPRATTADLDGSSNNNTVSVAIMKQAFSRFANGTLNV